MDDLNRREFEAERRRIPQENRIRRGASRGRRRRMDDLNRSIESEDTYQVERIVDTRIRGLQLQFFVKWVGYPDSENTWESEEDCEGARNLIREFLAERMGILLENDIRRGASRGRRRRMDDLNRSTESEETYQIERIVDIRIRGLQLQFFVKWVGYPDSDNTWESEEDCEGARNLILEFLAERMGILQENDNRRASRERSLGTDDLNPSTESEETYQIERIVDTRIRRGQVQYFVKYVGFPDSENTWESGENCEGAGAGNLIREFEAERRMIPQENRIRRGASRGRTFCGRRRGMDDLNRSIESEDTYQVERIVDRRINGGRVEYFVKWVGYTDSDNTWESEENFEGARNLIREFLAERLGILQENDIRSAFGERSPGMDDLNPNTESEETYQIERIVDTRIRRGQVQYFVKYVGFPDSENTWESGENCEGAGAGNLIREFEAERRMIPQENRIRRGASRRRASRGRTSRGRRRGMDDLNPSTESEETYQIERIVDRRIRGSRVEYFVKYVGFPDSENTWESEENCEGAGAGNLVREFEAERPRIPQENRFRRGASRGRRPRRP